MPADPQTQYEAVVDELLATTPATTSKMFGMRCLKINGKAFAGLHHDAMVFKLSGSTHSEALGLPGAHLFDPSHEGRPMKEWVEVPVQHASRWIVFAREALKYVDSKHK